MTRHMKTCSMAKAIGGAKIICAAKPPWNNQCPGDCDIPHVRNPIDWNKFKKEKRDGDRRNSGKPRASDNKARRAPANKEKSGTNTGSGKRTAHKQKTAHQSGGA